MYRSSEHADSATQCWMVRSASDSCDWIVLEWKFYYFILLVETTLQTTERACSFEQLPAGVNRMGTETGHRSERHYYYGQR